jgi:hypothetical protein
MPKVTRKIRTTNHAYYQKVTTTTNSEARGNKTLQNTKIFDAQLYIKRDLKWSSLTGGLVVIVLIILYIFLH